MPGVLETPYGKFLFAQLQKSVKSFQSNPNCLLGFLSSFCILIELFLGTFNNYLFLFQTAARANAIFDYIIAFSIQSCNFFTFFFPFMYFLSLKHYYATSIYVVEFCSFQIRPPQKRGFGRYIFLDFFHEFLRWDHKILHNNSWGLSGPSGRFLPGRIPFPATNLILNFIFL